MGKIKPGSLRLPGSGKTGLFFSADRDDTALAIRLVISFADYAAQSLGDVVDQDLVVQLNGLL